MTNPQGYSLHMRKESTTKFTAKRYMKAELDNAEMVGLCHVGLYARDPASLAEFYCDVMGMHIVGGSDGSHPLGASAFLSSRPDEESHEIAIFTKPELAHRAFRVGSLTALKRFHSKVVRRGIPIKFQFNHGVSIAFYFQDPEGNLIEVYWPTGVEPSPGMSFLSPPCAQQTDLAKTQEELLAELRLLTDQHPVC